MTRSIAELRAAGITFDADEAVAIVQELISALRERRDTDEVGPPDGPPSASNVFLTDEGSVVCRGCTTTPTVPEVGSFLDGLLPAGSPHVPGGVRYTIARAQLDVDVPPFDSLDELSCDLARHEHGCRADLVRRVLARAAGAQGSTAVALVERRRGSTPAAELRRALREADARWYEHHTVAPTRGRPIAAAAVCLAAGLALLAAGEFRHARQAPVVVNQAAPIAADTISPDAPRVEQPRGIVTVRDAPQARSPRPVPRRASIKHVSTRPPAIAARPPSRGVLDRLRLGWLRRAFSVHSDL